MISYNLLRIWPIGQAIEALRFYRDFMDDAPEDLCGFFAFMRVPTGPPFPEHLHLKIMCGVVWCYAGAPEAAAEALRPVREFGSPALDLIGTMPFPVLQGMFDPLLRPGLQWYWKGDFVRELSDEAIALHVEYGPKLPTPLSTMHLYPIDGAARQVGKNETAFSYREARWSMVIGGVDPDPANNERMMEWAKDY